MKPSMKLMAAIVAYGAWIVSGAADDEPLIRIPTMDISGETQRHSVVAVGTEEIYQGHVDTLLMPDGKTIFCAWSIGHARHVGPLARSEDGGRTWGGLIRVPDNWWDTANTPTIHRLVDADGRERLIVFADGLDWRRGGQPPYPMHQAVSEDGGKTWTPMKPNGIQGEVPPKSLLAFDGGRRHVLWTDLPGKVIQAESLDGGLTWPTQREVLQVPGRWAQPSLIGSPDGRRWIMLMRENNRQMNSLWSVSDDGQTWCEPKQLPAALTGDRHVARLAPDGRLVVAMRDQAGQGQTWQSPTRGHYVAWVGTFDDILEGREGEYRIKLLHSHAGSDCGYSGLEVLPDGTFVATTYVKYAPGPKKHSVISTRFRLDELDRMAVGTDGDAAESAASADAKRTSWTKLFDGKSLKGWKIANFGGEGEVVVKEGCVHLDFGNTLTGITYQGDFPKSDYEIRWEAMRVDGNDFFGGLTFPVGDAHCSFIAAGWAGAVVGLSCIDGKDASENATTTYARFENRRWYRFRVRVSGQRIGAWIDDRQVIDQAIEGHEFSIRPEMDLSKPLGVAAWQSQAVLRGLEYRKLE